MLLKSIALLMRTHRIKLYVDLLKLNITATKS
jgi:hypothetical protein